MDFFTDYDQRQRSMNLSALLDFTPLAKPVKEHLVRVYAMVLFGVVATGAGVYFQLNVFHIHYFLSILVQIGCMMALTMGSGYARATGKALSGNRVLYFGGFAAATGVSVGDLIAMAASIHPAIPVQAFFGSIAIFACFSLSAMFAKERKFLYLGWILTSGLTYFGLASLFNIFFRSPLIHGVILYGSLLMYMGFILYDTQVAIEDFKQGNRDYVMQAIYLYLDLVAIFVRLLIILMENNSNDNRRKNDRRK